MVDATKATARTISEANQVFESDPTDRLSAGYQWRSILKVPLRRPGTAALS